MERIEKMRVSDDALDLVFRKARTYNAWLPKPVPEELLRQLYDTLKWGPPAPTIVLPGFLSFRPTVQKKALRQQSPPANEGRHLTDPVTSFIACDLKC